MIKDVGARQKQCLNLSFELPEREKGPVLEIVTFDLADEISSCDESCNDAVLSDYQLAKLAGK